MPSEPGLIEHLRTPYNLADAALRTGHHQRGARLLTTLRERLAAAETRRFDAPAQGLQLWLDWAMGHWDGLAARARQLLDHDDDSPTATVASRFVLGGLQAASGNLAAGMRQLDGVVHTAVDAGEPVLYLWACGELARLSLARDQVDAASAHAQRGLGLVRSKGIWAWCSEPLPWAVAALVRSGDRGSAATLVGEADSALRDVDAPGAWAALSFAKGLLTAAEHHRDHAQEQLDEAIRAWEVLPRPHLAALARAEQGWLLAPHDSDRGIRLLTDAHDRLVSTGARWDAARVHRSLRQLGVSVTHRRGRRGYGTDLSPREREVAELAAAGWTNRDIAERLVLSLRTVEHHMSAVLGKLGVASRDQIVL